MSINNFVHDALNALREIATNETVDIESRINAADKILDYAARSGDEQGAKTDAIGFVVGEQRDTDCHNFGEYLKLLRKSKGLTLSELGELTGFSHSYLSQIESGKKRSPYLNTINKIADALDVEIGDLVQKCRIDPDEETNYRDFGEYLRKRRKGLGLTLMRLSEESGVSQPYLSQLESAKRGIIPSPEVLKKLESPLGVPYIELMQKVGYLPSDAV